MSIIGVHFPGHRNRYYEQLIELERVVCKSALLGPVTLLGDFKAHLGKMCGKDVEDPRVVLQELMETKKKKKKQQQQQLILVLYHLVEWHLVQNTLTAVVSLCRCHF